MEKISYNYSLKNIPIPSKASCNLKLIEKIESVMKWMRWRAYFFLNEEKCESDHKYNFGFKSKYHLPQSFDLEKFEKDLFNIVCSTRFSNYKNNFQPKLDAVWQNLNNQFVFADRSKTHSNEE